MTPGKTSDALRVKLRQIGSRIGDGEIAAAWTHAEQARVSFSSAAVALGVMLLAKKESLGHGKWIPWCDQFGASLANQAKGQIGSTLPIWREVTPRALRYYTFCAEHFLADLEQGEFAGEIRDHKPKLTGVTADEVLALDTLPSAERKRVFGRIEQFVAGRSLRTMIAELRRAENAAELEETEHEARKKKKAKDKTDPKQLDFYQDMLRPLGEIDTLFDTKSFVEKTDKAFWLSVADKLETQARRAREMAKKIAS